MMQNKENISSSLQTLTSKGIIHKKQIPEFPLAESLEEAQQILQEAVVKSDYTIVDFKDKGYLPIYSIVTGKLRYLLLMDNSL